MAPATCFPHAVPFRCVEQSLTGIEVAFEANLEKLRPFMDEMLDVKATKWHDAYNTFRSGVRDLGMRSRCFLE